MRKILIATAAGAAALMFQPVARAADPQAELKDHGCLACHDIDKKKVGPAYKDVAAKNKGKKVEELDGGDEVQAGAQVRAGEDRRRGAQVDARVCSQAIIGRSK